MLILKISCRSEGALSLALAARAGVTTEESRTFRVEALTAMVYGASVDTAQGDILEIGAIKN